MVYLVLEIMATEDLSAGLRLEPDPCQFSCQIYEMNLSDMCSYEDEEDYRNGRKPGEEGVKRRGLKARLGSWEAQHTALMRGGFGNI